MLGLEDPDSYTGHAMRRTAATILANKGASGQQLRHKLNHRSEKTVNQYLSSSKAVQKTNAMMLAGFQKKKETDGPQISASEAPKKEVQKETVSVQNKASEAPTKEIEKKTSEPDPTNAFKKAMEVFNNCSSLSFGDGCTFNFEVSK